MTDKEILEQVRKLLADPSHWTQRVGARDRFGVHTQVIGPDATQFCILGAVRQVSATGPSLAMKEIFWRVARKYGFAGPVALNDQSTHETVLEYLDNCILEIAK